LLPKTPKPRKINSKPLMLSLFRQRTFSSLQSSFKNRAAGKSKLNEFFKYTHPDMFS